MRYINLRFTYLLTYLQYRGAHSCFLTWSRQCTPGYGIWTIDHTSSTSYVPLSSPF